jgi:hypothetical protein
MQRVKQPTLAERVSAALYIISCRPMLPGVKTIDTLMWPYMTPPLLPHKLQEAQKEVAEGPWIPEPDDVRRCAAKLLASVLTELLQAAPPERLEQISTELAEYLSYELEPALQDERIPSLHGLELHPPQNRGAWLRASSDPYRHHQPGT